MVKGCIFKIFLGSPPPDPARGRLDPQFCTLSHCARLRSCVRSWENFEIFSQRFPPREISYAPPLEATQVSVAVNVDRTLDSDRTGAERKLELKGTFLFSHFIISSRYCVVCPNGEIWAAVRPAGIWAVQEIESEEGLRARGRGSARNYP